MIYSFYRYLLFIFKKYSTNILVFVFVCFSLCLSCFSFVVFAESCWSDDYDCQIREIQREIDALKPAHERNKQELADLKSKLQDLGKRIDILTNQLKKTEAEIASREEDLAYAKEVFNQKANSHYRFLRLYDPIIPFISAIDASEAFKEINFRQRAIDEDRKTMEEYAQDLLKLKNDKETLEKNKANLSSVKKQIDQRATFLAGEVEKVEGYLASLSAKQEAILAAKAGSFIASVGDSELADDYNASIKGFRESAPPGSFAVFSFGAYTHRKGMSQYGARARANRGDTYTSILKAYYGKETVYKDTSGKTINVAGVGSVDFENYYLMGIAEMPSNWHPEALKAQAVAARTYAYRYMIEGKTICTTESCQVFRKSKADNPPEAWKKAVEETKGQVIEGVVTFYSSTTGGYLTTMGWDTTDGSGGGNFLDKSYEKLGGSPWVYKAWYAKGYSPSGDKCGRNNPWLTGEELADIINAAKYRDDRVTPVTTSCWGGNPYSFEELRQKANGPSKVNSVSVIQGNGYTVKVIFQTDKGQIELTGDEFKTAFNLRAPGYLRIPQSGYAFFNIEKK
jgi:peptidoglycan hydrolase CwlO-like protein